MSVTTLRKKVIMEEGEKIPAKVHMSKKELNDLIEARKASGTDTSQLEVLLTEVAPEKPAGSKAQPVSGRELELSRKGPEELVTSCKELERLRTLACPHIRDTLFWEEFVSRRVLVGTSCEQPALFDF